MQEQKWPSGAKALLFIVFLTFVLSATGTQATVVDAPHNETNGITCSDCHSYSLWWKFSPLAASIESPGATDSVCTKCHGSTGTAFFKVGHSTASMGGNPHPLAGTWSTKCVDCHDPHFQRQVRWLPTSPVFHDGTMAGGFFLVEGIMSTITDNEDGSATFHFDSALAKSGWENPADWAFKSGQEGRGLILALGYGETELTFELRAASATSDLPVSLPATGSGTITVQTGNHPIPAAYENSRFGLFYGQLIKDDIKTPHSGSRTVKFFDGKQDFLHSTGETRDGVCQICHTVTKYWRNDGDADPNTGNLHNSTILCTACHLSKTGFKPSGGPHLFLGESQPCITCHPSGDILAIHKNNCQHCHTSPPSLADPATKPLVSDILRGTCQDCHGVQAHPEAHNHRQTAANCGGCHSTATATAIDNLHTQGCGTCHGYSGANLSAVAVANAIATGKGENGTDVTCDTCHEATKWLHLQHFGEVHHRSASTYGTDCMSCHLFVWNPVTYAWQSTNTHQCASCHNLNPPEALRIVNSNVSSLDDTAGTLYDMSPILSDSDITVGYNLVCPSLPPDESKAIAIKLNKEADLLSAVRLRLYISDLPCTNPEKTVCTPQTIRVYPYTANSIAIEPAPFVDYTTPAAPVADTIAPRPTVGWHEIDVSPLLASMKGFGWVKFRITNTTVNANVYPAIAEATMIIRYKRHVDVPAAGAMSLEFNSPTDAATLPNNQASVWTDTTTLLQDGNLENGILVQKTSEISSAAVMRLDEKPSPLNSLFLRLYVALPDGTAQDLMVIPYLATDATSLNTTATVVKTVTTPGWQTIDVTPLLQSMQSVDWAKFRIIDNSTQALVTEGMFMTVHD